MKFTFLTILLVCSLTITAFAQNGETQAAAAPQASYTDLTSVTDVRQLFGERERLLQQIRELRQEIEEQSAKISDLPSEETLQNDLNNDRARRDAAQKRVPQDQQEIDRLTRSIESTEGNLATRKNYASVIRTKSAEKEQKSERLFAIEQRIASLFDATRDTNQFRSGATWAFTGLVLVVVGGFFFIAYRKDGIASKIFGGEMGMQFVTLFLIVIAIILFGIMGTLEGKELAALLGGLSGYILGKTGFKGQGSTPNPDARENAEAGAGG